MLCSFRHVRWKLCSDSLFVLVQCLEIPYKPQYNGGIIVNPDMQNGSQGWSQFENAKVDFREFGGNKFVVATQRNQSSDSVSQKVYLEKGILYTFSGKNNSVFLFLGAHSLKLSSDVFYVILVAWLQVSTGKAPVSAVFKKNGEYKHAGSVVAESKCWSMLKGGLTVDESGPAELFFEVYLYTNIRIFSIVCLHFCILQAALSQHIYDDSYFIVHV